MSFSNHHSSSRSNDSRNPRTLAFRSMSQSRIASGLLVVLLACSSSEAFQGSSNLAFSRRQPPIETISGKKHRVTSTPSFTTTTTTTTAGTVIANSRTSRDPSTTRTCMTFGDVSEFYHTYPIQSAVLTCGFKASIADCIAQVRAWGDDERVVEMRRNLAYIIYGGIFIGLMSHVEYNILFPILFGNEQSLQLVLEKVVFDDFISAPLLWLPPAYLIKAMLFDYSLHEGLQRYLHDIRNEGLLVKYWSVWVPAQCVTFSVVPEHFRVAFMAGVSFFWFILFSTVSAKNQNQQLQQAAPLLDDDLSEQEPPALEA